MDIHINSNNINMRKLTNSSCRRNQTRIRTFQSNIFAKMRSDKGRAGGLSKTKKVCIQFYQMNFSDSALHSFSCIEWVSVAVLTFKKIYSTVITNWGGQLKEKCNCNLSDCELSGNFFFFWTFNRISNIDHCQNKYILTTVRISTYWPLSE